MSQIQTWIETKATTTYHRLYNGTDNEVPEDVTHSRIDSSVTVIPERSFYSCCQLGEVELPEGLIRIESGAFQGCETLERINIPSTVEEIGDHAFFGCEKLDEIVLPDRLQRLGEYAFAYCKSLKRINIPPNIETIESSVFFGCYSLTDIALPEGLREIGWDAFSRCESLVSVTLPSSLKVIGKEAFEGCERLNAVHMHDNIETIDEKAFKGCNITRIRVPPHMAEVNLSILGTTTILGSNTCFVSLELPENTSQIKGYTDLSVRNIAFPANCTINAIGLGNLKDLRVVFSGAKNDTTISEALQHRFDELPIHKICYYQSYYDNETNMQSLKREINPWTTKPPGQLNLMGKEQDCLGMTPLHILACSTKSTIQMYQLLIDKYPETLIVKDKWGDIPLLYAIWCNAPSEVIDSLVESYKSLHPDYEFDWSGMILTLVKRRVPLANIQTLINTQHQISPDYNYNMQGIVLQLVAHDTNRANLYNPYTPIETFRYLLQVSISEKLASLAVERWREELEDSINALPKKAKNRDRDTNAVYDRLAAYESIKEGTSVLELALWKAKIDEGCNKKAKVDEDVRCRDQCRISCGADIIISNVLPYLMPKYA